MCTLFLHISGAAVESGVKLAFVAGLFFANFATIKKLFQKILSVRIILDATFVSNLTFLGLLSLKYHL